MNCEILAIGDELLVGDTVDTNSSFIADALFEEGHLLTCVTQLPDKMPLIVDALKLAFTRSECVLVTGGLGPTEDDITREALAASINVEMKYHSEVVDDIAKRFAKKIGDIPLCNRKQAYAPVGAKMIKNPNGTAPGVKMEVGNASVFLMPGVPHEMKAMLKESVLPSIAHAAEPIHCIRLQCYGSGESTLSQKVEAFMREEKDNIRVGINVSDSIISFRIVARGKNATAKAEAVASQMEQSLSPYVFGRGKITLAQAVVNELKTSGKRVTFAESCTGGMVSSSIVDIAGSSSVFNCGVVTYSNEEKVRLLGVNEATLKTHGAVSEEVANEMAVGAMKNSGADIAISITGVAGPNGGTDEKPVGLVCFGIATKNGVKTEMKNFNGSRTVVRKRAAKFALSLVLGACRL